MYVSIDTKSGITLKQFIIFFYFSIKPRLNDYRQGLKYPYSNFNKKMCGILIGFGLWSSLNAATFLLVFSFIKDMCIRRRVILETNTRGR